MKPLFTKRQTQITELVSLGYTTAEIATQLSRSKKTIETHRLSARRRAGARTDSHLVRIYLEAKWGATSSSL